MGHDAERHELAILSQSHRHVGRGLEGAHIANHVIRGRHRDGGIRIDL